MRPRGRMKIFGVDDLIGGALVGGAGLVGNILSNQQSAENAGQANAYSYAIAKENREFNRGSQFHAQQFAADETQRAFERNLFQQDKAQSFSAGEAEKARQYTTMMSNSAYQRQVADMKAAGLNPIMAAMQGGGASTPSSPSPQGSGGSNAAASGSPVAAPGVPAPAVPVVRNLMDGVMSSAMEAAKMSPVVKGLQQDVKTKEADTDLRKAQELFTKAEAAKSNSARENYEAQTKLVNEQTVNARRQQSQINVLGTGVNPAYYADKVTDMVPSWMKSTAKGLYDQTMKFFGGQ